MILILQRYVKHRPLPCNLRLPPETTDRILDCLRGDRETLYCCALVCHAWHSRSLYNLFYSMFIQDQEALKSLVALSKKPHMMDYFKNIHELYIDRVCWSKQRLLVDYFKNIHELNIDKVCWHKTMF
ncbi:hypothetical protein B0H21DRAFT_686037 [Amylocystis lapponica]|nr:hypothetical protein B0H21DRAFT_686037 [Amylocystis lapponica]